MLSKQYMEHLQTAKKGNEDTLFINNTADNGDTVTIKNFETTVIVNNDGAYTQSLLLPRVAESVGMLLNIIFVDSGGGGTVDDHDDSSPAFAALTNNADSEYAMLYNNGSGWLTLATSM